MHPLSYPAPRSAKAERECSQTLAALAVTYKAFYPVVPSMRLPSLRSPLSTCPPSSLQAPPKSPTALKGILSFTNYTVSPAEGDSFCATSSLVHITIGVCRLRLRLRVPPNNPLRKA